jgi:MFS family permease
MHYTTFPVKPPTSRGRPPSASAPHSYNGPSSPASPNNGDMPSNGAGHNETPLPVRQLVILAIIALAEQTALNSISPYLPEMTASFPGVKPGQEGIYVGLIASAFACAQFTTNFFWGWLSDRIGRKPVILLGTVLTAASFVAFGFSRRLWHAIVIQAVLGLVNGNQGLVSTCLGEITDRSNQSKAFTYLPVIYGLGGITGPALGGLLVFHENPFQKGHPNPYPYLLPNLLAAFVLAIDAVLTMFFLEESLDGAKDLPPLGKRVKSFFTRIWQFVSLKDSPGYLGRLRNWKGTQQSQSDPDDTPSLLPTVPHDREITTGDVFNRDTVLLLITFLIFQLSNVAFNSLYPIFAEAKPPTGRSLSTKEIGLSMAFAGFFTIVFQIFFYGSIRENIGNRVSYRVSHALFVASFLLMPFVGYLDRTGFGQGKIWVWLELGVALILKTTASVGGLTSALLMVSSSIALTSECLADWARSQIPLQIMLFSANSMDWLRPCQQPVEPLALSYQVLSSPLPRKFNRRAKHLHSVFSAELRFSASFSALVSEANILKLKIGIKTTNMTRDLLLHY